MKPERLRIPLPALLLSEKSTRSVDADGYGGVSIVAYSGRVIRGHCYWGDLAIDVKGISLPKDTYPILENHDRQRKVGYFGRGQVHVNGGLRITGATLLDTDVAKEFRTLSGQGFPYEASIYAVPTEIERLKENESAPVNGLTMVGPGTVWRRCTLREVSVCVFGFDSETRAEAMSLDKNALSLDVLVKDSEKDADESWIRHMLALVGQQPEHAMSKQDRLTHNERMIRDFMNGEGIFAGEQQG